MNKVILIARLSKTPELSYAPGSGTAVCRFSVAVNRRKKKDQEKAEADFIRCVAFGKTGETIAQYIAKGREIAIEGNIRTGSYEAKDGTKRYTTDVVVESFKFIGGNGQAKSNNGNIDSNNNFGDGMNFDDEMTPADDGDMPF